METYKISAPKTLGSIEANENLRGWLRQHGDDGSIPRPVWHYAYPLKNADPQSRSGIVSEMKARGFEVGNAAMRNGLVFRHETSVKPGRFDELTASLANLLAKQHWEYDGWECGPAVDGRALEIWRQHEGYLLH